MRPGPWRERNQHVRARWGLFSEEQQRVVVRWEVERRGVGSPGGVGMEERTEGRGSPGRDVRVGLLVYPR